MALLPIEMDRCKICWPNYQRRSEYEGFAAPPWLPGRVQAHPFLPGLRQQPLTDCIQPSPVQTLAAFQMRDRWTDPFLMGPERASFPRVMASDPGRPGTCPSLPLPSCQPPPCWSHLGLPAASGSPASSPCRGLCILSLRCQGLRLTPSQPPLRCSS